MWFDCGFAGLIMVVVCLVCYLVVVWLFELFVELLCLLIYGVCDFVVWLWVLI